MGALIRAHDWASTALGPPEAWPGPLRTLLAVVLGASQPMFLTWGAERLLLYNDAYAGIIARKHPGALGRPFLDVWSEIRADLLPLVEQIDAGVPVHMGDIALVMNRHGYPEETHFSFSYTPVRDDAGRIAGIFCACTETTAQIAGEHARRASETRNRQILDSAVDYAIIASDLHGRVTRWNTGAQCILGWSETEMLGHTAARFFTSEDRAGGQVEAEMQSALATGAATDERWHLRKSGERFWAAGELTPLKDEAGSVVGFVKVLRDRTEQKLAAEALAAATSRSEALATEQAAILGQLAEGVIVADVEGRISFVNDAATRLHGVARLDVAPDRYSETYHLFTEAGDPYPPLDLPLARAVLRSEAVVDARWRIRRPDGTEVLAIGGAHPIRDAAGVQVSSVLTLRDDTARGAAEAALRESEARFRNVADHAPIMMWVTDETGSCTYLNRGWYEFTGQSSDSALGFGWLEAIHPDDKAQAERIFLEASASARPFRLEYRLRRRDGAYRWAIDAAAPRFGAGGEFLGYIGSVFDIEERREMEDALRASEARFRGVAEALPGFLWTADEQGRLDYTSPRWHAYSGSDPAESNGEGWAAFVHPDDQLKAFSRWSAAIADRTHYETEFRLRRADGVYRWWLARALPSQEETSARTRWIGVCTDIEEIVQARETLAQSRADLEQRVAERTAERDRVWRNSRDLLVVIGADGVFRAVNPAWTTILGHDPTEVIGRSFLDFIWPEDADLARGGLVAATTERDLTNFENRYSHKDGTPRWISWQTSLEGDLVYAYGRHVTAEKKQAEALQRTEEALRQAQKMEAVGQLTGGIAHDFNNLLTGIIGSLEMMQRRLDQGRDVDVKRYTTAAMTSANRAAALTHRLLAFSRRQPLDPKPVNANRLVSGMEELLRRTVGEAIQMEIVTAGGLWQTLCDPHQLENALLNLAINARDAMPGGGKLTLETCNAHLDNAYTAKARDVTPGQYVCICVTDTGTGMPADIIAKAFEPFFTTKPIGQGTGLGLSMIYGFARQSDGSVKIYSEVGQGTTVKLYLPRYYGAGEEVEQDGSRLTDARRPAQGEMVLVVEDETSVRDLVRDVLEELGYQAIEAVDGPSGLRLLQSDIRIDLLVTDVGLPGLNGRQLADAARVSRPDLRVLFMTGYAENAAIANGFLAPGMQMITKPFAIEALATRIREMVES